MRATLSPGKAARRLAPVVLPLLVAVALSACDRKPPAAVQPAPVLAQVVHALPPSETGAATYPVEIVARYANAMSFRVPGKLVERTVHLGDVVHKGQVVARLDPADAQQQEAAAQAALSAAEHRLTYAKEQLDRDSAQRARDLIAASQLEQTQDAYSAALAARDQAAAQLTVARDNLQYNALVADHDGVITSEAADTGQVLAAGQAVFGLAWSGETDAILDAAPAEIGTVKVGQPALVRVAALPGRQLAARVREVSPAADPQSRTYRVKLALDKAGKDLRLGMTGEAVILPPGTPVANSASALVRIPATALFHQGNAPAVWVIRATDSELELRPVEVRRYDERTVDVAGGLRDGESVLLAGVHTVHEGELVRAVAPLFAQVDTHAPAGAASAPQRAAQ